MSRSGYYEDSDNNWGLICYRGAVNSALRGKRGQAFLLEILKALDDLPEPKLIADSLRQPDGAVCALGAVARRRNMDVSGLDPEDPVTVAGQFGIAEAMAREIAWVNDDDERRVSDYRRYETVRAWVIKNLNGDLPSSLDGDSK